MITHKCTQMDISKEYLYSSKNLSFVCCYPGFVPSQGLVMSECGHQPRNPELDLKIPKYHTPLVVVHSDNSLKLYIYTILTISPK